MDAFDDIVDCASTVTTGNIGMEVRPVSSILFGSELRGDAEFAPVRMFAALGDAGTQPRRDCSCWSLRKLLADARSVNAKSGSAAGCAIIPCVKFADRYKLTTSLMLLQHLVE